MLSIPLLSPAAWTGSDEEFVSMVESNNWEFFRHNQGGPFNLFRASGRYNSQYSSDSLSSCAGDGFGIAALCVGAYRGWTSDEVAYTNILALLRSYDTQLLRNTNNFFNHFNNFTNGLPHAEYSPIDSTWLACGALLAAQYFKGTEVETIANRLFNAMNYRSAGPVPGMYYEYTILNIVGAGTTNGWSAAAAKSAWVSCTRASSSYMQGPLFWYQWPQAFVDFRHRVDSLGTNHFKLAANAILRQRQKCIQLRNASPTIYTDFGTNGWGLTSAYASRGYLELSPFGGYCTQNTNYGGWNGWCTNWVSTDEEACDSGTLVPICLPACMAHTPSEARAAMKNLYALTNVYGRYSFLQALNTGAAKYGGTVSNRTNAAMDYGCNAVVVENFRSGMPWKYFMSHPAIATGMTKCGFTTPSIANVENWNDGSDPNVWTGSTTYANSDGSNPAGIYENISSNSIWVNGRARKLVANGSGDVVRVELKETDQSKRDLLSFWLRGSAGGEQFDVGLRDAEGHETLVSITNCVGGIVSTNWQLVRIPLRKFAVTGNPNHDVRILLLGAFTVRFRAAGTVFMDYLAFTDDDLAPAPPPLGAACVDGRVFLRWAFSQDDDVVGYHLWRRIDTNSAYARMNTALMSARHSETDPSAESRWGKDHCYAVQAVDRRGNVGPLSSGLYEQLVRIGRYRDLDWGDGLNPNTFGGNQGRWGDGTGDVWYVQSVGHDGRTRMVRRAMSETNGVWIGLSGGNLSAYDALSFWVKRTNDFDVGIKSTNHVEVKVPIARYTSASGSWAHVVIPLVDFKGVDFAAADIISLTFRSPGNFDMDEVRFLRLEQDADLLVSLEGEDVSGRVGGSTNDSRAYASQGRVLGGGWATNAGDAAWFAVTNNAELNEAYVDARYACGSATGRTLQVLVNDEVRAILGILNTGGWGDAPDEFKEQTLRLGRITNTAFVLQFRATNTGAAVNLDRVVLRSGSRWFREAEDWDAQSGSQGADYKPGASGGEVLGASWGGSSGNYAAYTNVVLGAPVSNAFLRARYGQCAGDGRRMRVRLDGTNIGELAFSYTGGWLDCRGQGAVAELPLGPVAAGTHTLRINAESADDDVNIDWLRIADGEESITEFDTDHDGIPDGQELLFGTAINSTDTDSDGVGDLSELSLLGGCFSDPLVEDTDGDGANDLAERIAGTDPVNSASVFLIEMIEAFDNSTLFFQSILGRLYTVQGSTNLADTNAWATVESGIVGTNGLISITDTNQLDYRYYRLRATRP